MPEIQTYQQLAIYAALAAIGALGTIISLVVSNRKLRASAEAAQRSAETERERVETAALEDDTRSSTTLRAFAERWDAQLEKIRQERDEQNHTIAEQRIDLALQKQAIKHLEHWKQDAEKSREEDKQRIEEQSTLIQQQQKQIKQLIEQDEAQQQRIEELTTYWKDALSTVEDMRKNLNQSQTKLETSQQTVNSLRAELQKTSDELAAERKNVARLKQLNETLTHDKERLTKECKTHVQSIQELQSQLEDCRRARAHAAAVPAAADTVTSDGTGDGKPDTGSSGDAGSDTGNDSSRHPDA